MNVLTKEALLTRQEFLKHRHERLKFLTELMPWIVPPEPEPEEEMIPPNYKLEVVDAAPWIPTEDDD
jgi:hypothetical protein